MASIARMMCSEGTVRQDARHEGAVDLQLVEMEFAQSAERGLTGAEIVEPATRMPLRAQMVHDLFGRGRDRS